MSEASFAEIYTLIQKYLGIQDAKRTLLRFVFNLYRQAAASSEGNRYDEYRKIVKSKGGDEFNEDFIKETFAVLDHSLVSESAEVSTDMISGALKKSLGYQESAKSDTNGDVRTKISEKEAGEKEDERSVFREGPGLSEDTTEILEDKVYIGYVSNIVPYGAFIRLNDPFSFDTGLCHLSNISFNGQKVKNPRSVLKPNQEVFVKVVKIEEQPSFNRRPQKKKISLSMRGIDQETGLDKTDELEQLEEENRKNALSRRKEIDNNKGRKRRISGADIWELRQLVASGAIPAEEYASMVGEETKDDPSDMNRDYFNETGEEDVDVELREDTPMFLKGHVAAKMNLTPLKITKNPEGSMNRAAMKGSQLAQDKREEKIKGRRENDELKTAKNKTLSIYDPFSSNAVEEEEIDEAKTSGFIKEWKSSQANKRVNAEKDKKSLKEQRELLPVFSMKSELVESLRQNQFLVIVGETGSGKTTQIVQYLEEAGYTDFNGRRKLIGCTQPRRVAAVSVAKRVSEEFGCKLGEEVGYTIRFEDMTNDKTVIRYMTDGMLEREALNDPFMKKYAVIMLDEAHERTIATDILFALLKKAAKVNPDLKVIVTSATLDAEKFSSYFHNCSIKRIPGKTFPVEVAYSKEPQMDYLEAALDTVIHIHVSEAEGDILVFLTGQEEIETSCEILSERMKVLKDAVPELIILPVYASLPPEMQSRIFEPTPFGTRKVILATNIAETSITIDGIYYVIDPGFVKVNAYDPRIGMDSLMVSPISKAQANQRSGRAGRTGPGKCYRLYTEEAYQNEMLPNTVPEIQRQNLAHTILMLKAMGISDVFNFEFMDPPSEDSMVSALLDLYALSALDDKGEITQLGRKMAEFPMEPALAKTLIASIDFGCSDEILSIVAMLSVQIVFYRPKEKQRQADEKKIRFHHMHGDHLTLLNVYKSWCLSGQSRQWCVNNFIHDRSMRRAKEVRKQLASIMTKYRYLIVSCGSDLNQVRKTLCSGFYKFSAKRDPQEGYKTLVEQTPVFLHPSSALFGKNPEYVIYHTLLLTTKEYMHYVTAIDSKWLLQLAPTFFKKEDPSKAVSNRKKEKIVPLFTSANKGKQEQDSRLFKKRRSMYFLDI